MEPVICDCGKEKELYQDPLKPERYYWVCHDCKTVTTKCEVYSRVVGYLRPTDAWNKGKKEEWFQRKTYKIQEEKDG